VREQVLAYLAAEDNEALQYFLRLNVMLLIRQPDGPNTQQVADLYGMNRTRIGRWVTKVNNSKESDITVLQQIAKPGRNTRMDKDLLATLKQVPVKYPRNVGGQSDQRTGQLLSDYLRNKYGIALKPHMCQRWMRRFELEKEQQSKVSSDKKDV
jgi:hypothetical protein